MIIPVIYSTYRILSVLVYLINVLFFDRFGSSEKKLKSYRRSIILAMHNFVEILFWFASCYYFYFERFFTFVKENGSNFEPNKVITALNISFTAMTGFGTQNINFIDNIGLTVVFAQNIIGFFMIITILALFISYLPKPGTKDESEILLDETNILLKEIKEKLDNPN
jgi:Trk-type K+ transport system membrane component